jgi:hypothetical protein
MSQDPVAIDSVCLDFLRSEYPRDLGFSGNKAFPLGSIRNCDNYLHEAALGTNVRLGPYKPNGVIIGSRLVREAGEAADPATAVGKLVSGFAEALR